MARKYYPIWEKLKKDKKVMVSVHPLLFSRLTKAVIKEKDRDLAFKVANDRDTLYMVIQRDVEKHQITFILKQRIGLENIVVV